jgi:uncharacterized membrane protein
MRRSFIAIGIVCVSDAQHLSERCAIERVPMNKSHRIMAATAMAAALFGAGGAQAMEVQTYERMSTNDRASYTGLLVGGHHTGLDR